MSHNRQLLIDFSKGKLDAFNDVYALHSPMLYGLCMRYARCVDDANDMLQEAFIRIYSKMTSFHPDAPLEPWLAVITRNVALDFIRSQYRFILKEESSFFDASVLQDDFEFDRNELSMERILDCLQKLPDGYRIVFNLFFVENLTHKEIAAYLNISENTSKTQLMNAKKHMQKLVLEVKELSYGNR